MHAAVLGECKTGSSAGLHQDIAGTKETVVQLVIRRRSVETRADEQRGDIVGAALLQKSCLSVVIRVDVEAVWKTCNTTIQRIRPTPIDEIHQILDRRSSSVLVERARTLDSQIHAARFEYAVGQMIRGALEVHRRVGDTNESSVLSNLRIGDRDGAVLNNERRVQTHNLRILGKRQTIRDRQWHCCAGDI